MPSPVFASIPVSCRGEGVESGAVCSGLCTHALANGRVDPTLLTACTAPRVVPRLPVILPIGALEDGFAFFQLKVRSLRARHGDPLARRGPAYVDGLLFLAPRLVKELIDVSDTTELRIPILLHAAAS